MRVEEQGVPSLLGLVSFDYAVPLFMPLINRTGKGMTMGVTPYVRCRIS